ALQQLRLRGVPLQAEGALRVVVLEERGIDFGGLVVEIEREFERWLFDFLFVVGRDNRDDRAPRLAAPVLADAHIADMNAVPVPEVGAGRNPDAAHGLMASPLVGECAPGARPGPIRSRGSI